MSKNTSITVVAVISLILNGVLGLFLYQNSQTVIVREKKEFVKSVPFDYDSFAQEWGKAWLGLKATDVPLDAATRAGLDRAEGAYVTSVAAGSPAEKAGIETGNIVLSFNGRKIRTARQLQNDVLGSPVGTEAFMCVTKDDYRITVYALPVARAGYLSPVTKDFPWLGVEVAEVTFGREAERDLEEAGS